MSGPIGSSQLMYATGSDFYPYQIGNSLRGSAAGDTTLKFTAGTPSSTDIMTMSFWVKRHTPNSTNAGANNVFTTGTGGGNYFYIAYNATLTMENTGGNQGTGYLLTEEKYRDPAAWYHVILRVDTSQSTQFDRIRVYVNGQQLGLDVTGQSAAWRNQAMITNTAQNEDFSYLNADGLVQSIGGLSGKGHGTEGADLTIADFMFFDGQSYYSELGEYKNGVWIPKDPSGLTFGNNGYHLKFADSSDIGHDSSGNGNDFTVANFAAHDVLKDSPTFGGSSSGNFCVLNPLNNVNSATLSEGNTKGTGGGAWVAAYGTFEVPLTGSWYWEVISENHVYGYPGVQTTTTQANQQNHDFVAVQTGEYRYEGTGEANTSSIGTGDIIGFHVNAGVIKVYVNNSLDHTFGTNMTAGAHASGSTMPYYPSVIGSSACVFNFGQDSSFAGAKTAQGNADSNGFGDFYYSPKGLALCSGNIPLGEAIDPAETDDDYSQKAFDALTYVGNGQSRTISTDFKSDLLWIKDMDASRRHYLVTNTINANFGTTSYLHPSNAVSEGNSGDGITASSSSNFTISGNQDYVNNNTNNYVAYQWRLNGGTTAALNDGDINATGQINQTHGHGILLYTGDGGSSAVTMAHGMGAKPEFLWMKDRDSNGNNNQWGCWHHHMAADHYLYLSQNAAQAASGNGSVDTDQITSSLLAWNRTSTTGGSQTRFENGDNFIIYQFVSVYGHSKFGHYEGNGNANGTFVYTGFSPALVMVKSIDSTSDWEMYDNVRAGYNVDNNQLEANDEAAQDTGTFIDLLSNGFKLRASGDPNVAETYIYGAWAHNSLKYATAV